jgi:hypothetical protein
MQRGVGGEGGGQRIPQTNKNVRVCPIVQLQFVKRLCVAHSYVEGGEGIYRDLRHPTATNGTWDLSGLASRDPPSALISTAHSAGRPLFKAPSYVDELLKFLVPRARPSFTYNPVVTPDIEMMQNPRAGVCKPVVFNLGYSKTS